MEARMNHPAMVVPGAMQALLALGRTIEGAGVSKQLLDLVYLRASQINGCGVCVDMHARDLKKNGESDERLWSVAGGVTRRTTRTRSGPRWRWPRPRRG
jgi:AhpD family alkylhydroperoxidase